MVTPPYGVSQRYNRVCGRGWHAVPASRVRWSHHLRRAPHGAQGGLARADIWGGGVLPGRWDRAGGRRTSGSGRRAVSGMVPCVLRVQLAREQRVAAVTWSFQASAGRAGARNSRNRAVELSSRRIWILASGSPCPQEAHGASAFDGQRLSQ